MKKLRSTDDFKALQDRLRADRDFSIPIIIISAGTCSQASGASDIIRVAKREILDQNLTEKVDLRITGCHGFCEMEPSVLVEPSRTFYPRVGLEQMKCIVHAAVQGEILADLLYVDSKTKKPIEKQDDIPFFSKQVRFLLKRNEKVDPIRIYNYIEIDGYAALARALIDGNPTRVVDEVKASGLRGRGGAGFPTGMKWEMLAHQKNGQGKYLVCNADEGDPGAYMDRSLLEGNPHSIIEGMLIGAYGTGATQGVVYVRKEYPLAIKHLRIALRQAHEHGLLGEDILGTGFSFDINLVRGAGAFVCGEETALIQSIEGKIGEPRQRPPFPIQKGINGKPTVINNVETWANIPVIIKEGAQEFAKVGTENNSGTKIFSLVGKIKNTGLVEVPMGITIREIVYDIGGGPPSNTKIKAVQTGGPSGGCIPADKFDLHIDYDSLAEVGSIMGSGGMIVMDENTCMVDIAKYFMNFLKDESCGKCFTCRKGTQRLHEILDDISKGQATLEDLDLLKELAHAVKDTTMCGLGQTASNPVLSTLRYYYHEYQRHVVDKKCDAFVCKNLIGAACQSACPVNTEAWRYVALIEKGLYEEAYKIIRDANPFPSVCARVCDHKCEQRCSMGVSGSEPIAIRALKRFITDRVDPSVYKPLRVSRKGRATPRVAVIGAGPAGLSASHYLSLSGYKVTLFEADDKPGGMLTSCIPSYRLPREVLQKEINALLDENITLKCKIALGRDITIDKLFADGFQAIFLAIGAHKSMRINLKGEDAEKVYPSLKFLKAFNLQGEQLAQGHVVVVGGGNSAVDAARIALRQKDVESVTLLYRRTREEMPAFEEEIEEALAEGVKLQDLVTPVKINTENNQPVGMKCIRNKLQGFDSSDRPRPVPVPDTEFDTPLDTLIVAIGEQPDCDCLNSMGLEVNKRGTLSVDKETFCTNRQGVFAGGDLVSGSNTVIDAIAAGKKAAGVIDRYLQGKELKESPKIILPEYFIEPAIDDDEELEDVDRAEPATIPVESRRKNFNEVEISLTEEQAICEARRCLRCDLEFTQSEDEYIDSVAVKGKTA